MSRDRIVRHRGIRFATAERFEAPVPVPFEPRPAGGEAGHIAPQVPGMLERVLGMTVADMSEDCLFLNVFAPEGAEGLPVLVWIHGGAYLNGSGSVAWYDGGSLADRGHVVVTINYRLGALGFLGAGNWGTLDQICALAWVRDHIAGFGGDPGNVTVFGESAGGSAVVSLMAAPAAQGLFHAVWSMSPSILQLRSLESAQEWERIFLEQAGAASLDEARALPVERLLETQSKVITMPSDHYDMFAPTAGGLGLPDDVLGAAAANPVPLSVGTNRDESLLFLAFDPRMQGAGEEQWTAHLQRQFGDRAAEAKAVYEAARPGYSHVQLIAAAQTDHTFRRPAQELCEARASQGNRTWMYWFTWASPALGGILGSAHALDIPFAFDNLDAPGTEMLLGDDAEAPAVATRFADEISTFSAKGAPSWQPFDLEERATFRIDHTCAVLHDPEPEIRALQA